MVQLNEYDYAFALETEGTYMYMYIITVLYACSTCMYNTSPSCNEYRIARNFIGA